MTFNRSEVTSPLATRGMWTPSATIAGYNFPLSPSTADQVQLEALGMAVVALANAVGTLAGELERVDRQSQARLQ